MCRIAFLLLGCVLSGCASVGRTPETPSKLDVSCAFHAPYAQVVRATRQAMPGLGLQIRRDEERPGHSHILVAERAAHGQSWGEWVRVTVSQTPTGAEARVYTEPRLLTNLSADWDLSPELFSEIDQNLQRDGAVVAAFPLK